MLTGDLAHRLARVLRLGPGDAVELFDGSGRVWPGTVTVAAPKLVRLALAEPVVRAPEPPTILLAALIRPNRFEWLIEKATELGATLIQPVVTARSEVRAAEIGRARLERWRRIAVEAAEQSGRVTVPAVDQPVPLADACGRAAGRLLVATEPAHGPVASLGELLRGIEREPVSLVTGPEGGLSPDEVRSVLDAGGVAASLGPLVLRAETAAIACLAVLADARQATGPQASDAERRTTV
jgi:16S rRNA (uracil1498-N3)-methyltransferase